MAQTQRQAGHQEVFPEMKPSRFIGVVARLWRLGPACLRCSLGGGGGAKQRQWRSSPRPEPQWLYSFHCLAGPVGGAPLGDGLDDFISPKPKTLIFLGPNWLETRTRYLTSNPGAAYFRKRPTWS